MSANWDQEDGSAWSERDLVFGVLTTGGTFFPTALLQPGTGKLASEEKWISHGLRRLRKTPLNKRTRRPMKLRDGLGRKFSLRSIRGRRRSKT
jgi:hypothetical protein